MILWISLYVGRMCCIAGKRGAWVRWVIVLLVLSINTALRYTCPQRGNNFAIFSDKLITSSLMQITYV